MKLNEVSIMADKPIPIDENDMLTESCPHGGKHALVYNSDTKMLECCKCGKSIWSKHYYDKQPPCEPC